MINLELNAYEIILIVTAFSALVEQIISLRLGSYPYRFGLTISTFAMSETFDSAKSNSKIKIREDCHKSRIYFRYRYYKSLFRPVIFVGTKKTNSLLAKIKIGPITALFFLLLFLNPIFSRTYNFVNAGILLIVVFYVYYVLMREVKKAM